MQNARGDIVRIGNQVQRNKFGMEGLGNIHVVRKPIVLDSEQTQSVNLPLRQDNILTKQKSQEQSTYSLPRRRAPPRHVSDYSPQLIRSGELTPINFMLSDPLRYNLETSSKELEEPIIQINDPYEKNLSNSEKIEYKIEKNPEKIKDEIH